VARQLGHGAELTMRVYGHVIEELEDRPQLAAEDAIREGRRTAEPRVGTVATRAAPVARVSSDQLGGSWRQ
jgi:hypothetical protein